MVTKTKTAMLDLLRSRYPQRANTGLDSFEASFYLASINNSLAPMFDSTGARVP